MPAADIQAQIDKVYAIQQHSEFGSARYALLFLPGEYHVDIPVGFYTQVLGLGATPDAVHITGNVHSDASLPRNNATCTFWRAVEGFSVTPTGGAPCSGPSPRPCPSAACMSSATSFFIRKADGPAADGCPTRSSTATSAPARSSSGSPATANGAVGPAPTGTWSSSASRIRPQASGRSPPTPRSNKTPIVREKPFLEVDAKGNWSVRVPALQTNSQGITWHGGSTPGQSIPLQPVLHRPPGQRHRRHASMPNWPRAKICFSLPASTNSPSRSTSRAPTPSSLASASPRFTPPTAPPPSPPPTSTASTSPASSSTQARNPLPSWSKWVRKAATRSHAKNPIFLHDVFFRVGGAGVGRAKVNLLINSNDTIIDHTWIWRADHGAGVGWTSNLSDNGLVVNGNNVTAYGLFVEHHQQFQVLWNGNHGRTYFYQSEIPYDPPDQSSWTSAPGTNGWASYKVADNVTNHEAWGLGIYSVFRHPNVTLTRAIEVPVTPGVRFHHMITVALDNLGEISNVIDDKGGPTHVAPNRVSPKVTEFPQ